eukprot:CAMPEP_0202080572 /NCGR_PEP_ID=MMETSP0964-20121228/9235_1 /ASSEMBLY_ACC=CAM_ASM_000500 /TAXON_ID=4773 /ORGANISM="Schizochytrium aggregatum, Strain ATCC28209" /LENGTH=47 /DNA_ID= /DNA_START= /DNA_END= /DNA_ORIENTATION=
MQELVQLCKPFKYLGKFAPHGARVLGGPRLAHGGRASAECMALTRLR